MGMAIRLHRLVHAVPHGSMMVLVMLGTLLGAACGNDPVPGIDLNDGRVVVAEVGPNERRDLDLLVVFDDSASTFYQGWPTMGPLWWRAERWDGRLPNLHYGVISQDMGAGPSSTIPGCEDNPDGRLQHDAGERCGSPSDHYVVDIDDGQGGRLRNFAGTLDEVFTCITQPFGNGCGFEQPLAALRRAIDGSQEYNAGFLRPEAALLIVIVMDEDDCSVVDPALFDPNDGSLGPLSSYRCFEYGVTCDEGPTDPREPGPRSQCHPQDDSPYMMPLDDVFSAVLGAKRSRADIGIVAAIGDTSPISVSLNDAEQPLLQNTCGGATGEAGPGIRLESFVKRFGTRGQLHSACTSTDYADLATGVGSMAQQILGVPCLIQPIGVAPDCVGHRVDYSAAEPTRAIVPACTAGAGNAPCFSIEPDASCSTFPEGLAARYVADASLADEQRFELRCRPLPIAQ